MRSVYLKWGVFCFFILLGAFVLTVPVFAEGEVGSVPENLKEKAKVDEEWEKAADTNKDGIVDSVEIKQWKNRHRPDNTSGVMDSQAASSETVEGPVSSVNDLSQVNRPWEKAADTNHDGRVDKVEFDQWKEQGNNPSGVIGVSDSAQSSTMKDKARVDRPWEKAADDNQDGRVDKVEMKQWNKEGNNPPGPVGGPGRGSPGRGVDRR